MVRARKRFGQHWLRDNAVVNQIVQAAAITPEDCILEVGPGTGILTQRLIAAAQAMVAVEIDRDLCRQLNQQFEGVDHFQLIQGDFLDLDLEATIAALASPRMPNKVVANIPYYITGPILEKLLGRIRAPNPKPFESIVLLLQKEVAERLYATPGHKTQGALTVRVQYLADCELVCPVPAKAFHPKPKVDSAVICLRPRPFSTLAENPKHLDQLVTQGFSQKRKMLRNNLKGTIDREVLTNLLTSLDINPQARAEDLTIENWVTLSNRISTQTMPPQ